MAGGRLQGSQHFLPGGEGDSVPDVFIPALVELWQQGRFPFDRLIRHYDVAQIDEAATDSEKGVTLEPVLRMPS